MYQENGLTRREREITDVEEIRRILDESKIVHVGMCLSDEPYVVPMNYGYILEDGELTLYLHGAKIGKKLDIMRQNPKVFFEIECAVTPFEGDIACRYGIAYSSVMGRGVAEIIDDSDVEEKKKALSVLMKTQTGKDFSFDDRMAAIVSVIRIKASGFTAKHRPMPKR